MLEKGALDPDVLKTPCDPSKGRFYYIFFVTIYLIQFVCISLKHKNLCKFVKMAFAFSQRAGAGGVLKCAVGRRSEIELNI